MDAGRRKAKSERARRRRGQDRKESNSEALERRDAGSLLAGAATHLGWHWGRKRAESDRTARGAASKWWGPEGRVSGAKGGEGALIGWHRATIESLCCKSPQELQTSARENLGNLAGPARGRRPLTSTRARGTHSGRGREDEGEGAGRSGAGALLLTPTKRCGRPAQRSG
jgi:hypothetical protein